MAYTRLLRVYYRIEGPIPKGEQYRLCRARSKKQKRAVDCILFEFFVENENFYRNSRCDVEIASYKEKVAFNQRVGKLGGRPRGNPDGTRTLTQTVSENNPSHTPIASSQEPVININSNSLAAQQNNAAPHKKNGVAKALPQDASQIIATLPLRGGGEFEVRESFITQLEPLYPDVDINQTLREMRGWCLGNPGKLKKRGGIKRFITSWLQTEQEKGDA